MNQHYQISLIEDCQVHRQWLQLYLSNAGFDLVSIDSKGKSGIESVRIAKPALVLLDFQLEDLTGLEVAKRIKSYNQDVKVFMLTAHTDAEIIDRIVMDSHVDAVAVKGSEYLTLNFVAALKTVINGGTYVDPSILISLRESRNSSVLKGLSKREFEVFFQLSMNKTDREIANDLSVEVSHVRNLKSKILRLVKTTRFDRLISNCKSSAAFMENLNE